MPDARVIPIAGGRSEGTPARGGDTGARPDSEVPRRTPTRRRPSASDAVAAGAARASNERARRRRATTPLLREPAPAGTEPAARPTVPGGADAAGAAETPASAPPGAQQRQRSVAERQRTARLLQQAGQVGPEAVEGPPDESGDWERRAASALAFLRRRLTGDYEVDEFGFDRELTDAVLMAAARPLYERWFRVDTIGIGNVPAEGGALVVANHSGTIAVDAVMTQLALLDDHPARRSLRMLGADLVFTVPWIGELARKSGSTLACSEDAERLLSAGELVGVWPEGFKGIGKPFSERYKLQRFGRGGFVAAALRTGVPIVPCSIVGAEEIYPILGNLKTLARLLGLPYLPVTPTFPWLGPLGLVPLPSKWMIEFGAPIETASYGPGAAEDPMLVFNLTDQVRETIQHTLYNLLMQRRSVFF